MTVVDASVVVDALVSAGPPGDEARERLGSLETLHAPAILRAEVVSALCRMTLAGVLGVTRAEAALTRALQLRVVEYPFEPFAARTWELRDAMTIYDAWYVATAEALDASLLTSDARLGRVPGLRCTVDVIGHPPNPSNS